MKIGIVTVYDAVTNVGSYLQAFAMKTALEELGHEVVFVEKESCWSSIAKCAFRLNPKRSFFLRLKRCLNYLTALKEFSLLHQEALPSSDVELLLYGMRFGIWITHILKISFSLVQVLNSPKLPMQ